MSTHAPKEPATASTNGNLVHHHKPQLLLQQTENTNGQSNAVSYKLCPVTSVDYEQVARDPEVFSQKLEVLHRSLGTKLKIPTIGGKALDLHRLFMEVTSRGGIEKVVKDRKWKEVIGAFNFPSTITSASFVLRKYYVSLLYHFEQVYYLGKEISSIITTDSISMIHANGATDPYVVEESAPLNQLPASPEIEAGSSVTGVIDAKFDTGYLITVNFGSEMLKGVLYHTPPGSHSSQSSDAKPTPSPRNRKKHQLALRDPSRPKANRSGYNFFFAENYNRLKPSYHGQERALTKKIGLLWTRLTDAEKQVYQEKGMRDKERYRAEMNLYRASNHSQAQ